MHPSSIDVMLGVPQKNYLTLPFENGKKRSKRQESTQSIKNPSPLSTQYYEHESSMKNRSPLV